MLAIAALTHLLAVWALPRFVMQRVLDGVQSDPGHPLHFRVRSSDGRSSYLVDLEAKACNCPDSQKGYHCKHRIAAYYFSKARTMLTQQPKPAPVTPKQQPREAQILRELGFDAAPGLRLGSLYRRYLHGEEIGQQPLTVTISAVTRETVQPHPNQPASGKWCLWVNGLPGGLPNGILFGAQGESELLAIFGRVTVDSLKGKALVIYPHAVTVAGQPRIAIRFKKAQE